MRFYKYFLMMLAAVSLTTLAHADDSNISKHDQQLNERDLQALKDFLRQKRLDATEKKPDYNLTVTGDVRTEWRHMNEKIGHHLFRGGDARDCKCIPLGRNDFDIEANLLLLYDAERTWATMHLQFDNAAGIDNIDCHCEGLYNRGGVVEDAEFCRCNRFHGSGDNKNLNLKRAFFGVNVLDCGDNQFDVEIGRRPLYDVFDSEIQFLSRFDGILLKYSGSQECVGDYYAKLAGFIVDERVNHFAWATELGLLNIHDSGFDVKYSFIDWAKRGHDRCNSRNPRWARYRNSQVTLSYHLDPEILCRPVEIFGAALYNHTGNQVQTKNCIAEGDDIVVEEQFTVGPYTKPACVDRECESLGSRGHNRNWAWYAGFLIGDVEKEGDWSFEFQYQWVQQNAISFDDENGIGVGDFLSDCCGYEPYPGYKGWLIDVLYGVTDDLTVELTLESTRKNQPGPHHTYSKVEIEAVYAF